MEIAELLQHSDSKTLEFKSDLSSLDPIIKTVVAFANTAGGTLIIGYSPGEVVGVGNIFKAEERLANAIADSIHPEILPEIEICTIENKSLLIVRGPYWRGPFYIKKLGMPHGVYVRLGSTSRPAGPELVSDMQRTLLRPSFDEEPLEATSIASLDLEQIKKVFHSTSKSIDESKLLSLGVLTKSSGKVVCSVGGVIFFGKPDVRGVVA